MSKVNPYQEQIAPRGANNDFQDPSTADAGVGQAARSIGQSIARIGAQHKAVEDDQGRMWAAAATAENEVRQRKAQSDYINSLDPSAPDYLDKINSLPDKADEQYQQSIDQLQESAPNDTARKYVAMHGANGRVRMLDASINDSANLNATYAVSQVDTATKTNTDLIAASPDNATFAEVNERHRQTIMDMQTIDPSVKLKLADQSTHQFALAQVQSVAAKDPASFLQTVHAQGGVTTRNGVRGAVPGGEPQAQAQPEMLAFANSQLDSGKSPEDAMKALMAKYPDKMDGVKFVIPKGGSRFLDEGTTPGDPQVQPLTDTDIANANPGIEGWKHLSWPEKVSAVRSAEGQIGKSLAEERGALSRDVTDAQAAALDGKRFPGLDSPRMSPDNLKRVFGDDQGGRMAQELSYSANVGDLISKASIMPAAQRAAMLQQYEPQPGQGDYAEKSRMFDMAQRAVKQVEAQQQAKPIESAITSGIAGAKPLDFTQPLAPQLHDRTIVSATMVRDYGTKPQIFTEDEVNTLANSLGNQTGKDRIATLMGIRTGLVDNGAFGLAMNELAPKNPNLAFAGNLAARGGTAYVDGKPVSATDVAGMVATGDIILNGRSLDKQMAKGDDPSMPGGSRASNFKESDFRLQFQQRLGGAFRTPDAQLSAATQESVYNAAKAYYAAESFRQGKPLDQIDAQGVKRAIDAVVGTPWQKNGGTLLAPYGMPVEQFQNQWNDRASAAVKAAGFDDDAAGRLLDNAVPVNLADGKYGFQIGTALLADPKTHRKVIVDFHQPYQAPTTQMPVITRQYVSH